MEVYLAQPRGFCAGVVRAIEIVERALEKYGPPVYVRHEIVHNKYVVESLKAKGAIFVEDLSEVPPLAVTVFSAHGVARSVEEEGRALRLHPCPRINVLLLYAKGLGINREGQAISSAFALHLEHSILDEKIADIKRGHLSDAHACCKK